MEYKKDFELWQLVLQGNQHAFDLFYKRHAADMFLYAMKILNNQVVCQDIVQNIFLDLWLKRYKKTIVSHKSYLLKAVKYQILKHLRDHKIELNPYDLDGLYFSSDNASSEMEEKEILSVINSRVTRLPKRCQQIFILSRYQYKSNQLIATELGISVQAVKNQISKALSLIKRDLKKENITI
ncbi:MAG: sigma-70 family RNA polymerase sigma factor [Flavobacteriaceae bacterium]|nr:sigma-70 family RNA polymerase sigma factor [Flavobacteriaceae bacterium]